MVGEEDDDGQEEGKDRQPSNRWKLKSICMMRDIEDGIRKIGTGIFLKTTGKDTYLPAMPPVEWEDTPYPRLLITRPRP